MWNKSFIRFAAAMLSLVLAVCSVPLSEYSAEENPAAPNAAAASEKEGNYSAYKAEFSDSERAEGSIKAELKCSLKNEPCVFAVEVEKPGLYSIGLSYKVSGEGIGDLKLGFMLNGEYPFAEAEELVFPRVWVDETDVRTDGAGNQFAPKQIPYDEFYKCFASDITEKTDEEYTVYLNSGINEITLVPISGEAELEYFELGGLVEPKKYTRPENPNGYKGEAIILEGEAAALKTSYWLSAKSDNSSSRVTPSSSSKSLINYIGGDNWKTIGETIIWETPQLKEGYYKIGASFRQSTVIGGKVYRKLTVDGEVPFSEAKDIGFEYSDGWQNKFFSSDSGEEYLIYLTEGTHQIGLTAVPGRIYEVTEYLESALAEIGSLYIDITMIVGETVDIYRDYDLFDQISEMQKRLEVISSELKTADKLLKEITGQESGSNSSVIKNMIRVVEQMLDNRYTAHRYKTEYYNKYTALAAVLYDMRNMPLDIDKLVLSSPEAEKPFTDGNIFKGLWFSAEKFIYSFINDYNSISDIIQGKEPVTIWVNWGRDQAQVLDSLIRTSFTEQTGITVNLQLVNASIVQAILSGKGPDCFLQHARTEPVDLAMRGALYDLTAFDDLEEVLGRFQEGAELPYRYKGGLYALPDTQTFFMMFYRKDILDQLGIAVPETWDEFEEAARLLARSNLTVWVPNNPATDLAQTSAGIGSINLFPTLLLQRDLDIYSEDGRKTNLSDTEVMLAFGEWTDWYRKLKLPAAMDFYNRFRTGTCPIGISSYNLYTTLVAAASEIDGLWSVAPVPGTVKSDGSISAVSAGAGSACAILKDSENPSNAWEFLKWWTSAETQLAYSNEVESILGPTGRVTVANVEAFKLMQWDEDMLDPILKAWSSVKELPEYPGSYYVSRSLYQSFWNVLENNKNPKDMLIKYGKQADMEMARKWAQYENR